MGKGILDVGETGVYHGRTDWRLGNFCILRWSSPVYSRFFFEHFLQAIAGAQPRGVLNCPLLSAMFDNANLDTEFERSMHL